MAILKRIPKGSDLDERFGSYGRNWVSTDGDDDRSGSDDSDGSVELEENASVEFCQLGDWKFLVPIDLYDLTDLSAVLSLETWNDSLSEDERFALSEFLPDMDEHTFMRTLKELFTGAIFHFGSPVTELFDQMKGGLLQPQVALYRQGLNFLQKREHYHFLYKYQNSMVGNLLQIKEAWGNCAGYGIEERIRLLNIMRSQKVLMQEKDEEVISPHSEAESLEGGESMWSRRANSKQLYADLSTLPENFRTGKASSRAVIGVKPSLDSTSRGLGKLIGSYKFGKNQKRILKVVQKGSERKEHAELGGYDSGLISQPRSTDVKDRPRTLLLGPVLPDQSVRYETTVVRKPRSLNRVDNPEEQNYEMPAQLYHNPQKDNARSSIRFSKLGKKMELFEKHDAEEEPTMITKEERQNEGYLREGSSKGIRMQPSSNLHDVEDVERLIAVRWTNKGHKVYPKDTSTKDRHSAKQNRPLPEDQTNSVRNEVQHVGHVIRHGDQHHAIKGNHGDRAVQSPLLQQNFSASNHKKMQRESKLDASANFAEQALWKNKKWKMDEDHHVNNASGAFNLKSKTSKRFQIQLNDSDEVTSRGSLQHHIFYHRTDSSWDMRKRKYDKNGEDYTDHLNVLTASDGETHSSSSIHSADEVDLPNISRRTAYNISSTLMPSFPPARSADDPSRNEYLWSHGGADRSTLLEADPNDMSHVPKVNVYSSRRKLKEKADNRQLSVSASGYPTYLRDHSHGISGGENNAPVLVRDGKETLASGRNGLEGKRIKAKADLKSSIGPTTTKYQHGYESDDIEDDSNHSQSNKLLKRCYEADIQDVDYSSLRSFNEERLQTFKPVKKKKKGKGEDRYSNSKDEPYLMNDVLTITVHQVEDASLSKKQLKKKIVDETGSSSMVPPGKSLPERRPKKDASRSKLPKKSPVLIKPGFSFSIIHLLSSVRTAFIDIGVVDTCGNYNEGLQEELNGKPDGVPSENFPSVSFQDIVSRVRLRPGDPSILKAQEPLQDLVRGVLKIFSAKTAPLGVKGWKPLALYKKAWKSWSWIGPLPPKSSGHDSVEVQTSPEAWSISQKMLVKLVDSYATWLKNDQETLRHLGSLPAPPASLLPILDEKERFRDLRAQKSLTTINPSSDEVRAYFWKEEYLRYTVPDRAFAYTAADGRKCVVAPLRRGGGKPISKARDHFMLKPDRPPHVTVLCLVRDAAARLPGSIGTRADVCTLIRDSQYIVEDVSDAQVNQVVSGALDRLHYERDPCVQFDGERKLWIYLHRDRDDEDFEDDGTSSTKKWKRQKKDGTAPSDTVPISDADYLASADQIAKGSAAGYDACDFNVESSPVYSGSKELADIRTDMVDNEVSFIETQQGIDSVPSMRQSHQMGWEVLEPDSFCRESNIHCP